MSPSPSTFILSSLQPFCIFLAPFFVGFDNFTKMIPFSFVGGNAPFNQMMRDDIWVTNTQTFISISYFPFFEFFIFNLKTPLINITLVSANAVIPFDFASFKFRRDHCGTSRMLLFTVWRITRWLKAMALCIESEGWHMSVEFLSLFFAIF